MKSEKSKYKVVSLFSGAMGLDLGLDKTNRFELLACIEIEKSFCDTIRTNISKGKFKNPPLVFERDISKFSVEDFLKESGIKASEIDLIVGGPPCQSFSTAGKRKTVQDHRGTLLWHYLRFIEGLKPKFFLMENVRGLVSAALKHRPIAERPDKGGPPLGTEEQPGSVLRKFAEDLQNIDGTSYHMDCFEVNAVNYGAPQLRERVLLIGNRYNSQIDFPEPTHGPHCKKNWSTLRDAIGNIVDPGQIILDFSPRKKSFLEQIPEGSNWRSLPEEIQKESMGKAWYAKGGRSGWWRRLSYDLPCPTLVTMPNHSSTSLCHPTEVRALSLREYAAIQEFPDDWEICGTASKQYAQVGNAVPVRLGEIAGYLIASQLDALKKRRWRLYPQLIAPFRIIYIQSHVRTRQWFKDGKSKIWKDSNQSSAIKYQPPVVANKSRTLFEGEGDEDG